MRAKCGWCSKSFDDGWFGATYCSEKCKQEAGNSTREADARRDQKIEEFGTALAVGIQQAMAEAEANRQRKEVLDQLKQIQREIHLTSLSPEDRALAEARFREEDAEKAEEAARKAEESKKNVQKGCLVTSVLILGLCFLTFMCCCGPFLGAAS